MTASPAAPVPARAPQLPAFAEVARLRPVDLVSPTSLDLDLVGPGPSSWTPLPAPAPFVAVEARLAPGGPRPVVVRLGTDDVVVTAELDDRGRTRLAVTPAGGAATTHAARRGGRARRATRLGLTITGRHATALTSDDGATWTARARVDLVRAHGLDPHADGWAASLHAGHVAPPGAVARLRAGGFGQLGLRDLRVVTEADGGPHRPPGGGVLLSATSAGPGFFDTAHTSLWHVDLAAAEDGRPLLTHRADLFVRRPGRGRRAGVPGTYGDHATHVLRDPTPRPDGGWLVAASTWGDFTHAHAGARVDVVLGRVAGEDPPSGRLVVEAEPMDLPAPPGAVGVWDPHLVRTTGEDGAPQWLVGGVSARRWFEFGPLLAEGPALDRLHLRASAADRTATEGTTLHRAADGTWWVLASDGPDSPRARRRRYPVLDLDLRDRATIDAPYPTNLPWPTLVTTPDAPGSPGASWIVTFDGTGHGGRVVGYGSHGDVVLMRAATHSCAGRA